MTALASVPYGGQITGFRRPEAVCETCGSGSHLKRVDDHFECIGYHLPEIFATAFLEEMFYAADDLVLFTVCAICGEIECEDCA